jgi:hypothetical protein
MPDFRRPTTLFLAAIKIQNLGGKYRHIGRSSLCPRCDIGVRLLPIFLKYYTRCDAYLDARYQANHNTISGSHQD